MRKRHKVNLIFHGSSKEIPMGEFESAAAAKRYVKSSEWKRPYSIKKMAKGGMMEGQTVSEAAEQAVGSATWHRVDEMQKAGVVGELVTDGVIGVMMAEGSMVATGFIVTYILMDGKKIERKYKSKEDMDEGIANAYLEFDIENIEVAEEKPAKEKVGLFAMAKKAEPKKSKGAPKP